MPPAVVAGGVAVVIDVIRASTTITTALSHDAEAVYPVETVDEARALSDTFETVPLLGGERGGVRIDGFNLGNSPREYTPAEVRHRRIVFTTTNGTAAIAACREAAEILIGGLVNRSAVATAARTMAAGHETAVHLVCAGVERQTADEDTIGAGGILDAAASRWPGDRFDDAAVAALRRFREACGGHQDAAAVGSLTTTLADTPGGRRIVALGMREDLAVVAALDSLQIVPVFERTSGRLLPLPDRAVMDPTQLLRLHSRP